MYIRVYNVGFGDSSIIVTEDYAFLVDCGTLSGRFCPTLYIPSIINDIDSHFGSKHAYIAVTHFHEDHCNLLHRLKPLSVKRLIVPNFFSRNDIDVQLYLLRVLSRYSAAYSFASNMLNLIPGLVSSKILQQSSFVHCVSEGTTLDFNESSFADYKIHNPPKRLRSPKLNAIISRIDDLDDDVFADMRDQIAQLYGALIEEGTRAFNGLDEEIVESEDVVIAIDDATMPICERLHDLLIKYDARAQRSPLDLRLSAGDMRTIRDYQNQISLVFYKHFTKDRILFLGDVNVARFYEIVAKNNYTNVEFEAIKVAHHGTTKYCPRSFPPVSNLIISNRLYKNWCISEQYPRRFNDSRLICTNNNGCEYFKKHGSCCNIMKTGGSSNICGFHSNWYLDIPLA